MLNNFFWTGKNPGYTKEEILNFCSSCERSSRNGVGCKQDHGEPPLNKTGYGWRHTRNKSFQEHSEISSL